MLSTISDSKAKEIFSKIERVLETCASQILLQRIIASIDENMHSKENEITEGQSDHY